MGIIVQIYAFKMKRLFLIVMIVMLVTIANATWMMPGYDQPLDQHPGFYQHGEDNLELLLDNPTFSRNIKKRNADPRPQDDDPTKPGRFQARPIIRRPVRPIGIPLPLSQSAIFQTSYIAPSNAFKQVVFR